MNINTSSKDSYGIKNISFLKTGFDHQYKLDWRKTMRLNYIPT